jgi:small GTP-binding protein
VARVTREEIADVRRALLVDLERHPPTIGVVGVSGTGKSSTINAMFKTNLAISHTRACTKQFEATDMKLTMKTGAAKDELVSLVVVDAPGLGEDIRLDPEYIRQYQERLPGCDVILWVLAARNRAMSLDQRYLEQLSDHKDRMVFGVNQVDIVHPMDWNPAINLPSVAMEHNIEEIVEDRADKLADILGTRPTVMPFAAEKGFNLEQLFGSLLSAIPKDRQFIYDALKNFSYEDFVPVASRKLLGMRP